MDKYNLLYQMNFRLIDVMGVLLSIRRFPFYLKNHEIRKNNTDLLKKKASDTCYIIGNGPSLKTIDLTKLHGDTMVTNLFYKFEHGTNFRPSFYFLIDEQFYFESHIQDVKNVISHYPETNLILNGLYRERINTLLPKTIKTNYLYIWNGSMRKSKKLDCTKLLPAINNVVGTAICTALYMNYEKIILIGCDFSSFASVKDAHCYNVETSEKGISLAYELYNYSLVANSHEELQGYAMKHNTKIFNATQGSLIDAYERISSREIERV